MEKEIQIIKKHIPDVEDKLAEEISQYVHRMRDLQLEKTPGVAETLDWVRGVMALKSDKVSDALSCVIKSDRDANRIKELLFAEEAQG